MKENIDIDTLLDILSKNEIIIYGSGHVGMKFFKALKMHHMEGNILCFVVSHQKEKQQKINGISVQEITKINETENTVICIATHEVLKNEIVNTLESKGIKNYVWIYPFLYELLLGVPTDRNVSIDLNKILKTCVNDYRFAIRYMVIEQYFGKNTIGYDMYIRAESLHCDRKTSEKRLHNFCELIHSWEQFGYRKNSNIFINTNYEIIDGRHRITVAKYFREKKVICDIFSNKQSVIELHGENVMQTEKVLRDGGFSQSEIEILDEINKIIVGE